MIQRKTLFSAGLLLAVIGTALGWRYAGHQDTPLTTAPVMQKNLEHQVLASGTLSLAKQVNIGAQVNGQITALHAMPGDQVKKGDLLVEIDPVLQENALRKAQASLSSTAAQLNLRRQQVKHLARILQRQKILRTAEGVSQADVERAEMDLAIARQEVEVLESQRQQALIEVDSAKANVGYTRITAPMDGTVLSSVAQVGQTIVSAQAAPILMVLGDPHSLLVKAKISEADITHVAAGQPVWFTVAAQPDKKYAATLEFIAALPENATAAAGSSAAMAGNGDEAVYYHGTFQVENHDGQLRPAMHAQVRIVTQRIADALVIPLAALGARLEDQRFEVQVTDNRGKSQPRQVTVGLINGHDVQIVAGLAAGERVVIPAL
ncbi:efflux RND transporter periplasmic adaptor subunit [Pantoea cypripedii]|uniref:efflux RND transporter periplasmic adaptor subunit n=1 Tax=Pantoea cypripedii TaxID=55209 RepID=UPI002FC7EF12